MPTQTITFKTKTGKRISFKAKVRSSPKTKKALETRLKKLKSPKMRQLARAKWNAAHA